MPGYWAWGPGGYYWVPGTWVPAPQPGYLWTPGYWGYSGTSYGWHPGYWATTVGFYGGVNYGGGYYGNGYAGGRWHGRTFEYNTAVVNVNRGRIRNVYVDRAVVRNASGPRVAYNGGRGGLTARPTAAQLAPTLAAARPYTPSSRPAGYQPLRAADRAAAKAAMTRPATRAAAPRANSHPAMSRPA